jgi:hypothetical protein
MLDAYNYFASGWVSIPKIAHVKEIFKKFENATYTSAFLSLFSRHL